MSRALRYKCIGYGVLLLVAYIFQSMANSPISFLGYTPNLMLLMTLAVAHRESETFSAFFGLAAGVLYDVVTNNTVGICAIYFMFLAFFVSVALQTIFRRYFVTYLLIALAALSIFSLGGYLAYIMLHNYSPFWHAVRSIMLPQIFWSGVWAYPTYYAVYRYELSLKRRGIVS